MKPIFHTHFCSHAFLRTCVELFFINFDRNTPIIHRPSLERQPDSDLYWLLLVIVLIGTTYGLKEEPRSLAGDQVYLAIQLPFATVS